METFDDIQNRLRPMIGKWCQVRYTGELWIPSNDKSSVGYFTEGRNGNVVFHYQLLGRDISVIPTTGFNIEVVSDFGSKLDPKVDSNEANESNPLEIQEGGSHYKKMKIQPVTFITENNLSYLQGNVVKYISRYKDKNGIEDLKKAKHYIDLIIETEYK